MEHFNGRTPRPEFTQRRGEFPGHGAYKEKVWLGLIEGGVAIQLGRTSEQHVVTRVVETRYIVHYDRKNIGVPFNRLSVEYLIERSRSSRYKHLSSRDGSLEVAKVDGILPVECYCGSGLRGEGNWLPNHLLSRSRSPHYPVQSDEQLEMYANVENYYKVLAALEDGPIYAEFITENDYGRNPGGVLPHRFNEKSENLVLDSHAVCVVGYGVYYPYNDKAKQYFLYLNTLGVHWGDKGYGRIEWDCLSFVWIPNVADAMPSPQPLPPSPPPHDHDTSSHPAPSSHHGGSSRTTQSRTQSQDEHKKMDDLKRKRESSSGGSRQLTEREKLFP